MAVAYFALIVLVLAAGGFGLSRRKRREPAAGGAAPSTGPVAGDPIDAFWRWWQTARQPLAKAIDERRVEEWTDPLSDHVYAIDPGLAWELGPGVKSAHHLCVTSEGNAVLRVTAERWLSRAPAPDALWEYYPARQPSRGDPKMTLEMGGVELDYDGFRVGIDVDETRRTVAVKVHHPKLGELSERQRSTAMFLMLDDWLGEDGVERWIGHAKHTLDASEAPEPRQALREAVDRLSTLDADSFTLLEGKHEDGRRKLALVNFGVKRIDHLLMDVHFEVTISYPEREDGFYSEAVGEDVNAIEDALLEALGHDAVHIGHETGLGRRVVHLHASGDGPARGIIERWERMYPTWDISTVAKADPRWEILGLCGKWGECAIGNARTPGVCARTPLRNA